MPRRSSRGNRLRSRISNGEIDFAQLASRGRRIVLRLALCF